MIVQCPFCPSREAWTRCSCDGARHAQTYGMISARRKFPSWNPPTTPNPESEVMPHSDSGLDKTAPPVTGATASKRQGRKPAADAPKSVVEPKLERKATARPAKPTTALAPKGECAYCDARRKSNAERVAKHRKAKKQEKADA